MNEALLKFHSEASCKCNDRCAFKCLPISVPGPQIRQTLSQKYSKDRKMDDRKMIRKRIKFVMIPHSGMFAICSFLLSSTALARCQALFFCLSFFCHKPVRFRLVRV
jgi:hypothetical protein